MIEIRPALPEEVEQKRQAAQAETEFRMLSNGMALRAREVLYQHENAEHPCFVSVYTARNTAPLLCRIWPGSKEADRKALKRTSPSAS